MYMSYPVADRSTDLPFCSQFRLGHCRFPILPLYGSARTLSRARVGMRALSPDRQSPPMANTPVTPEVHQSFNIHRNFPTQIAFGNTLCDFTAKRIKLSVCQVTNRHVRTDSGRITYLERAGPTDAEDVCQGDPCVFSIRNIDSSNTCHSDLLSLLSHARTQALRLVPQPCLCLCRASLQMTRTAPLRRIILQFRHNRLTDARTFIRSALAASSWYARSTISLQVGLLQQPFVLVRHQM